MTLRFLVADDSSPIQKVIKIAFSRYPVEIFVASSLSEVLRDGSKIRPDLLIIDASLPGIASVVDINRVLDQLGKPPTIALLGSFESIAVNDLLTLERSQILRKPFDTAQLVSLASGFVPTLLNQNAVFDLGPPSTPLASEPEKKGLPAFTLEEVAPQVPPPPVKVETKIEIPPAPRPIAPPVVETIETIESIEEMVSNQDIKKMVREAVDEFCRANLKNILREVISAELKKLADEKSRHLVDN
jgi:CheY-like chemotaxis protein